MEKKTGPRRRAFYVVEPWEVKVGRVVLESLMWNKNLRYVEKENLHSSFTTSYKTRYRVYFDIYKK